ncbi:MAG TPA: tyrosine-type recombinase/integrase [Candidatus Acidoferrum sp.]|nr:tyrosine-type recombinase/integrase [Candidatus Acidoferrum sp.]
MKLRRAINQCVSWKHFCGKAFLTGERDLKGFLSFVGNVELHHITKGQVASYIQGRTGQLAVWKGKASVLSHFFRHWIIRGELKTSPMPRTRHIKPKPLLPYVYTRAEIRNLLAAVDLNQRSTNCVIDARTFRTFLVFLYGSGAYFGEAIFLAKSDIDFTNHAVKLRRQSRRYERTIPIALHLYKVLLSYDKSIPLAYRNREYFFVDKLGRKLNATTVEKMFVKLRRRASVSRKDDLTNIPRLHDFRHTFAVHSLSAWLNKGKDLRHLLPALSAYMGHSSLSSPERYLSMLPERFRPQVFALIGSDLKNKSSQNRATGNEVVSSFKFNQRNFKGGF